MNKQTIIFFNKYLTIPEEELEKYEHNNIDGILTITLKNKQIIRISNYTLNDFNKIEYKRISSSILNDEVTKEMEHSVISVEFAMMQKHIDNLEDINENLMEERNIYKSMWNKLKEWLKKHKCMYGEEYRIETEYQNTLEKMKDLENELK